ncbi:MAG: ribonuclease Z [Trebouxia sp. A1-2]|nr:MAG: ribonuclease Z [Trebouxia sp. A1-2]
MQISFLGTAGSLTTRTRSPSCIAVRAQKAVMLFDCGEDAQRQLIKQPQIVHGRVNRIFVTSNSSENIYGIPGMLCTLNWARERGFESADIPLHVYGPPGLADYIRTMLLLSDTYSMVPILVHEFATAACDPEPQPILTRARLYRVLVPPDQLNPNGYYDGNLDEAFLTRFDRKKKTGRADLRASAKRIKLPSPDGSWVLPEQVVGPDQPGRKICMLGATDNLLSAVPWVQAADAIVLGADSQVAGNTERATSKAIAAFATAVQATQLLVTRLPDDKATTNSIVRDIAMLCQDQVTVVPAYDHMVVCLERRKPA